MGEVNSIPLTQGKSAIVDADDYEYLSQFNWHYTKTGYAARKIKKNGAFTSLKMHRDIMNPSPDRHLDHINREKLDNRKSNLRFCTDAENNLNKAPRKGCASKYKGVWWSKERKKWVAEIKRGEKRIRLGRFICEKAAALAYNKAASDLHGEYAYLNEVT